MRLSEGKEDILMKYIIFANEFPKKYYDPVFKTYLLDYPNEGVKEGFFKFLVPYYIQKEGKDGGFS